MVLKVVYFIKKGKVGLILPEYDNFELLRIRQGHYFGEADLLRNREVRLYSMQALETCELYILSKKLFKKIYFQNFRDLGEEILANAILREARFKELETEAKEMLEAEKQGKKEKKRSGQKSLESSLSTKNAWLTN
jgi:CRP-like cAMP-binding protein